MISTTAVPSGVRGGASLAGSVRSSALFVAFLFHVDVVLAGNPEQAAALLDEILERRLPRLRDRFHVPVVDDDQLVIGQILGNAVGRTLYRELVGFERVHQVFLARCGIVGNQQHARAAQGDGVFETGFAQTLGGDLAGERDGAGGVDAGLQAQVVVARRQGYPVRLPMDLPSAVISTVASAARGDSRVTSTGKRSPLNTCPGNADGFEQQAGLGAARQSDGVDGDAELLRLPDGAGDAAQVFIAVGNQQQARHHAGGQRADAVANGGFQIGAMAADAGGVAQLPTSLRCSSVAARRVARANGITRIQWRPRAAVQLVRQGRFRQQILSE